MILDELEAKEVKDAKTFARFCQQRYGTPYPTVKGLAILNKNAKALFNEHPDTTWQTLVQVARWCHGKKRRMAEAYQYVNQFRWAYADGGITLRPVAEVRLDEEIAEALKVEERPEWRARMMRADGVLARRQMINEWYEEVGVTP